MKHFDELGNVIWAHHKAAKQTAAANTATNLAPGYNQQAQGIQNTLLPAYKGILANPGYDQATKTAATQSTLGGIGATYRGAADEAANRMARTRNTAGYGSTLDELARSQARDTGMAEAGLQTKFGDVALQDRNEALKGMQGLYGIDTETMNKLLGTGTATVKQGFDIKTPWGGGGYTQGGGGG